MIVWKKVLDLVKARALSSKKIRVDEKELERNIQIILTNILYFNKLSDFDSTVYSNYMNLKDVVILNEFIPFVIPTSVRYFNGDQKSMDLLVRDSVDIFFNEDGKGSVPLSLVLNYNTFLNAQIYFRGIFKENISSNITTLDSLKVTKSLSDVINIAAFISGTKDEEGNDEILVKYESEPFIPVILNLSAFNLFRNDYVNADIEVILIDYFNRVRYS